MTRSLWRRRKSYRPWSIEGTGQWVGDSATTQPNLRDYPDDWGVLDSYYIPTRYPNDLPDDIPARVYNRRAAEAVAAGIESWFAATG